MFIICYFLEVTSLLTSIWIQKVVELQKMDLIDKAMLNICYNLVVTSLLAPKWIQKVVELKNMVIIDGAMFIIFII